MQLFSNGKILVSPNGEELDDIIAKLVENAKENYTKELVFDFVKEPTPHYLIPEGVSFSDIKEYCYPDVSLHFKVFGEEVTEYYSTQLKEIKYIFTQEEKLKIADELCELEKAKEEQEDEKKLISKQLAEKVKQTEADISIIAAKFREGYELRNMDTKLAFDFPNKQRIYMDTQTNVVLLVEEMKPEDYQLQFNFDSIVQPTIIEEEKDPFA